ncbi:N-acetylmuramoyl-L-alanine amidase family protein [Bacillus toyonensis]|uniref:N-acetylmuramoyl-L-alanine amidase family protein n=1 Tax=Bacillus toyonensis TaxID=155322 RepID=UPI00254145A7|nr:cell wall-binding protein [Bacillus toyonensis]WIG34044.1 cell wall-binding protein [Bacillus toyonensis]
MNGKETKRVKKILPVGIGKKVIPVTAALGILFSMAPIGENKASAIGKGVILDVTITSLGILKDIYNALGIPIEGPDPATDTTYYAENISYRAPSFKAGEFNISMHHTKEDSNFTKPIKVLYPDGQTEIHKLKSGQQLKITEAGTIIDLNPYAESLSEHNFLYITQAQLDEGKTGVALNQAKTIFVEKSSGQNPRLVKEFYLKNFGESSLDGFKGLGEDLFSKLTAEQKKLATLTSVTVSKDVLDNYVNNDSKARADLHNRLSNILADRTTIIETSLLMEYIRLNDGKPYQIIPYKKGTNKVIVKTGSKYLSGKEGNELQYSDTLGDDEVFELVQVENNASGSTQFRLNNKNGVSLVGDRNTSKFGTGEGFGSGIRFDDKNNDEIHNWLREWYPGKENEKQKYDEIQIVADEKDPTKLIAKDPSGNVIKNSWVNSNDHYYYANSNGYLAKGWQEVEGNTYYFDPSEGYQYRSGGAIQPIEGKFYHFNDADALQRSAWKRDEANGLLYSDASGEFIKEGLREIDGKIYYFKSYGANTKEIRLEDKDIILHFSDKGVLERASKLNGEASHGLVGFDGKTLVFEKDGSIRKNGVSKVFLPGLFDKKEQPILVYYSLAEGAYYSGWKEIDGKKYHFQDGKHYILDGNETIEGKKYYFNNEGEATEIGLVYINGKTYYLNDKGEKVTGVHEIDGNLYFFSRGHRGYEYGQRVSDGIYKFDGIRYYVQGNGVIPRNYKGYGYNNDQRYYIETNNDGVATLVK